MRQHFPPLAKGGVGGVVSGGRMFFARPSHLRNLSDNRAVQFGVMKPAVPPSRQNPFQLRFLVPLSEIYASFSFSLWKK